MEVDPNALAREITALTGSVPDAATDRFLYYEQGDTSNVVSKGTFLMSVDNHRPNILTSKEDGRTIIRLVYHESPYPPVGSRIGLISNESSN